MTRLIIVDRDGVINQDSPHYIKSANEWQAIPSSLEAIAKLNSAGFKVVVATNQSGIARGLFDIATLDKIHQKMLSELSKYGGKIDKIYICPHRDEDNCHCRKPKIGLFQQIQQDYSIDFSTTYAIGDSFRDIVATLRVGCRPILVKTGNGRLTLKQHKPFLVKNRTIICRDMANAIEFFL